MDRRAFFQQSVPALSPQTMATPSSGLTAFAGPLTDTELYHLLDRCFFGVSRADLAHFKGKTLSAVVSELLNPVAPLPSPPVKEYTPAATTANPDTNIALGSTWVNDNNTDGTVNSLRRASFKKWWMGVLVNQDRSLREKMTLFWHNHFATETTDIGNAQYVYKHHNLLRTRALGNFKSLVKDITLDPAMLVYLNGQLNTSTAPDENYGRELQELFCCGKGPGSQYTEADVKAAARVLTGWRNNATTNSSYFTVSRHDTGNKTFSAFYNNTVITGRNTANGGEQEIDDLLNMIFATNEVALYLCRRLYTWFVYYDIDAQVETNVIQPLAQIFRSNNYNIQPVLQALLSSQHFFDSLSRGCLIKSPIDLVVGLCRECQVVFQPASDYITNYGFYNYLVNWASSMQQNLGDPPDVSGWKAYYQAPQFYQIWINSDTLPKRNQFTDTLVVNGYTFNGKKIQVDGVALVQALPTPRDPNLLLTDLINSLFRFDLTPASKAQLKRDFLLSGQSQDYYWTEAWDLFVSTPSNTANTTLVRNRIRDLIKYLMNLAEYQLA
ncbi:MAG: DUF1800 domain-containing protein [Sphingobacteriia bacterium]|nr:MAG: DUF1800 domain-containing protein [Sphingobacteriia bacterium]